MRRWSGLIVSPTYCLPHTTHLITYTRWEEEQVILVVMGKRSLVALEIMQFRSSKIGQVKQPALPQAEVTLAILYLGPGGAGRGRFNLTSPLRADLVSIFRKLIAFFRHIIGWDAEKTFDVSASTTRSSQLAERRGLIGGRRLSKVVRKKNLRVSTAGRTTVRSLSRGCTNSTPSRASLMKRFE
jgi:hypothetical protein